MMSGWKNESAFLVVLLLSAAGVRSAAQAASSLPTDSSAVFKTAVPTSAATKPRHALPGQQEQIGQSFESTVFSGSPYNVNAPITPTSTVPEAEEHIAVDPNNFSNLVSMISDFSQNGGFNLSKFAVSSDNGLSWSEGFVPTSGGFPATADGHTWQANSDPVVAIDKSGNVFLANLYLQLDSFGNVSNDGYYVCSANLSSGPKFAASDCHAVKTTLTTSTSLEDKPWLAVDNSASSFAGTVYATWTHFSATSDMIFFSRSTDHGVTWSKPIQISTMAQNGAVQGSQVAVGPGGEVYVAYEVFLAGGQGQHFIAKSTNGGLSFGARVPLTPAFNNLNFPAFYRENSFPAIAVSPVAGKGFIYDVYTDQPGTNARTAFVRSIAPGRLAFTSPQRLNDKSKGQRLMPAVATDTNGIVHISWFDTRDSGATTELLDIYATYTKDNGMTFAPNARVTTRQINNGGSLFLGDYSGIAAAPNGTTSFAHPAWTDGGVGGGTSGQLQTAKLRVP